MMDSRGRDDTRRPMGAERKDAPTSTGEQAQRCYNCNGVGHFKDQCPHPRRQREYVRVAHMTIDDVGDVDNEEDNENSEPETRGSERVGQSSGSGDDNDENDIIEVPTGDFYEGNEADIDFYSSLFTFPMGNTAEKNQISQPDPQGLAAPLRKEGKTLNIPPQSRRKEILSKAIRQDPPMADDEPRR